MVKHVQIEMLVRDQPFFKYSLSSVGLEHHFNRMGVNGSSPLGGTRGFSLLDAVGGKRQMGDGTARVVTTLAMLKSDRFEYDILHKI